MLIVSKEMAGGGLMQLVAYGAQDVYLTGNPQITFFKVVYRRHTNFSSESIEQTINGSSTLTSGNATGTVTISRNGDLVGRVVVTCAADDAVDQLSGDQVVNEVALEIGGQEIDKHTLEWMQVWSELSTPESKAASHKYMTGSFSNLLVTGVETNQQIAQIPLQFSFCRNPGLALPLIALQYHEVKLKFTWGTTTEVSRDGSAYATAPTVAVWADYYYLDTDERRRFAQVSHEYLIEQLQYQTEGSAATKYKLNFNHPVKELVWTNTSANILTQKAKVTLNGHDRFSQREREYFQLRQPMDHHTAVPGYNVKESEEPKMIAPIDTGVAFHNATVATTKAKLERTQITFDSVDYAAAPVKIGDILLITVGGHDDALGGGADQVDTHIVQLASVSTAADPVCVFKTAIVATLFDSLVDDDGMSVRIIGRTQNPASRCSQLARDTNVYSFALKPEEHQPSGTCNFSRIDTAYLEFDASATVEVIYAVNYNVLRIMSGMGGLAYSN